MTKNLVIVESPAKAKTIEKFLGKDYKVMSSYGHIRDLKKKDISITKDGKFEPVYEVPEEKAKLVAELKKAAKGAEMVWLASDEDREGEAIAWHLYEVLGLKPENTRRIVFHEITKPAILHAIENPRTIDLDLVNAQQARRVLDRLVGFELSPVLWKKIKPSLSAGRVQSVAVRLVCEREAEVKEFTPTPFYRVSGRFATPGGAQFRADMSKRQPDSASARELLCKLSGSRYEVGAVKVSPVKKSPAPPFTTSTLQQEASRRLGFPVSLTMSVAQRLYEAGLITYMRTDSLNLSSLALGAISAHVTETLGAEYLKVRHYHTSSKGAQEAHEAIRPTYIERTAISGTPQEQKLYNLIWKRTIASQMADAELERTTVEIRPTADTDDHFTASGEVMKFEGFMKVYLHDGGEDGEESGADQSALLPPMKEGDQIECEQVTATERFTQQPARYNEGSLVKKLEELGIGRPSTYAPTISTIQAREYVEKGEKPGEVREYEVITLDGKSGKIATTTQSETTGSERGKLLPTDTGIVVNDFLTEHFPDILDYDFTAKMEEAFDQVAEGKAEWHKEITDFYDLFHPEVEKADKMRLDHKVGERVLGHDPKTGEPVSVKIGRYGPIVQIGDAAAEAKPRFASLRGDQSVFSITLEEALKLFDLPRVLGTDSHGKEVKAAIGRFGPYVSGEGVFASIPKELAPQTITLEEALELIAAKKESEAKKVVKKFDEEPDLQILNGRWGPYISYNKGNYKIPKTEHEKASELTYEEVKKIIENQPAPKKSSRSKKK